MLLRLLISDNKSAICLFEKVWKWIGPSPEQGRFSLCKLTNIFYQFSREVGDSVDLISAQFEKSANKASSMDMFKNTPNLAHRLASVPYLPAKPASHFVNFLSEKNDCITVSIYYASSSHMPTDTDANGTPIPDASALKNWLKHVLRLFVENYTEVLASIKSTIDTLHNQKLHESPQAAELLTKFQDFSTPLENITNQLLPNFHLHYPTEKEDDDEQIEDNLHYPMEEDEEGDEELENYYSFNLQRTTTTTTTKTATTTTTTTTNKQIREEEEEDPFKDL